jgi:hypothetical protein
MGFPGYLQCGAQAIAHQARPRFVGKGPPIFLPQPLPDGLRAGNALGLGSTVAAGLPPRLGQERRFPRGLGDRQPPGHAPLRIRRQPAPHGVAIAPEQAGHLAAGAGLLRL